MKLAHELGVEHAHFTVEDESPRGQLCDRGGQISEARGVVNTLTEMRRTPAPSFSAIMRHPSYLVSKTQPGRWKGARASVGCIGTTAVTTGSQYRARVKRA